MRWLARSRRYMGDMMFPSLEGVRNASAISENGASGGRFMAA